MFDIYTIIFLALAVFIFLRLRSVLGQRTGRERPPFDPYSARDAAARSAAKDAKDAKDNNKVITLPTGRTNDDAKKAAEADTPAEDRWKDIAQPGSEMAIALDAIAREDGDFDAKHFVTGARAAYEMIVTAFAAGDRKSLKNLLSREVYDGFDTAISGRESRGETAETHFVALNGADIVGAEMRAKNAQITVRFNSQLISMTRDRNGAVIEGSAEKVTDVTDVWTFARDVSSRDPNWKLVATEAGQ